MSTGDEYMLSTKDNPYDPFVDYDFWFAFDTQNGYNSCSLLARVANTSYDLSESENNAEIDRAITEIIAHDPTEMFIRVKKGDFTPPGQK